MNFASMHSRLWQAATYSFSHMCNRVLRGHSPELSSVHTSLQLILVKCEIVCHFQSDTLLSSNLIWLSPMLPKNGSLCGGSNIPLTDCHSHSGDHMWPHTQRWWTYPALSDRSHGITFLILTASFPTSIWGRFSCKLTLMVREHPVERTQFV